MKYSLIAILLFSFIPLQAQVKGTVKDNLGDPIAGANLFWQGTTQGTTTSADGTFSLSKPNDKHMLVVSFIREPFHTRVKWYKYCMEINHL